MPHCASPHTRFITNCVQLIKIIINGKVKFVNGA